MARTRINTTRRAKERRGLAAACLVLGLATTFAGIAAQSRGGSVDYASWQARSGIATEAGSATGLAAAAKASPSTLGTL